MPTVSLRQKRNIEGEEYRFLFEGKPDIMALEGYLQKEAREHGGTIEVSMSTNIVVRPCHEATGFEAAFKEKGSSIIKILVDREGIHGPNSTSQVAIVTVNIKPVEQQSEALKEINNEILSRLANEVKANIARFKDNY